MTYSVALEILAKDPKVNPTHAKETKKYRKGDIHHVYTVPEEFNPAEIAEQKRADGIQAQIDALREGMKEMMAAAKKDTAALVKSVKDIKIEVEVPKVTVKTPEMKMPKAERVSKVHVSNITRGGNNRIETADLEVSYVEIH